MVTLLEFPTKQNCNFKIGAHHKESSHRFKEQLKDSTWVNSWGSGVNFIFPAHANHNANPASWKKVVLWLGLSLSFVQFRRRSENLNNGKKKKKKMLPLTGQLTQSKSRTVNQKLCVQVHVVWSGKKWS